jgi:hypothetical protein
MVAVQRMISVPKLLLSLRNFTIRHDDPNRFVLNLLG